MHCVC